MFSAPKFEAWSLENLAKFAYDAYAKLVEQEDQIQQLNCDLKTAIEAYRRLNKDVKYARLEGGYKVPLYRHPVEQTKSLQRALDALGPTPPECCGCQAEWQIAIDAIKEALADHAIGEVQRLGQEIQPEGLE